MYKLFQLKIYKWNKLYFGKGEEKKTYEKIKSKFTAFIFDGTVSVPVRVRSEG